MVDYQEIQERFIWDKELIILRERYDEIQSKIRVLNASKNQLGTELEEVKYKIAKRKNKIRGIN